MQRIDSGFAGAGTGGERQGQGRQATMTLKARLAWIVVLLMSALVLSYSLALYTTMGARAGAETESARPWLLALLPARMDGARDEADALRELVALVDGMSGIRHVRIELHAADGRLLARTPGHQGTLAAWLRGDGLAGEPMRKPVTLDGRPIAFFDVAPDGADEFSEMWADFLRSSLIVVVLSALAGLAIVDLTLRAFAPVERIRGALRRFGRGEQGTRLERFGSAEMEEIATAFNRMAGEIESAQAQRQALLRKLLDHEERTRRSVAQELHDDLSPYLVALQPLSHLLRERCARGTELQDVAEIARTLVSHQSTMLSKLRGILVGLRPPELETMGLRGAIEQLVAQRGSEAGGRARIELTIAGDWQSFGPVLDCNLYLMIQSCLSEALRQPSTRRVRLHVAHEHEAIEVLLQCDGECAPPDAGREAPEGIGVHERCMALGGRFDGPAPAQGGWQLRIHLPSGAPHHQGAIA
ncbi:histidine kinase [Rubrivivax gelatinosus]|uniref:sensor histidine kinase n=1 Tax=Rubrivivax gelatinosus TaxID=28068 RepID=UPI003A80E8E2